MDGFVDGIHPGAIGSREVHYTVFNSSTGVGGHVWVRREERVGRELGILEQLGWCREEGWYRRSGLVEGQQNGP
jgi:hypothetical protein